MPRKSVDLKAAKAAKQKKIAIGGALLFVALLIFSVPKTLKMMHPHHAVQPVSHVSAASGTVPTTPSTTPTTATPTSMPVSSTTGAPVLTAELAPAAREGQLEVLSSSFKTKDPFKQLVDDSATTAPPATTQQAAAAKAPAAPKPATESTAVPAATPATAPAPAATPTTAPAVTKPSVQKVVLPLLSAVISVNGKRAGVGLKQEFPAKTPLFHLLSLTNKTAKISVVGGSLAGGGGTLTLRRGKALTLVNTADGTRFRLVLLKTSTKPAPAQPTSTTAPQTQTQTTGTQTTQTQTTPSATTTTSTTDTQGQQPADTITVPALGG
jgi:hypothetical protein